MRSKKSIFIFIDWFDPAYKAGGPIRSVTNLVQSLQSYYSIYIFTSDKDLGDTKPMKGIDTDVWINYNNARVFYASSSKLNWKSILHELKSIQPNFVYVNSLFSKYFAVYPLLMKRIGLLNAVFILAPKGMLRSSALQFKPFKKNFFLTVFRFLRIASLIRFHATDAEEEACIKKQFTHATVFSISDSPAALPSKIMSIEKLPGKIKLLFVGRIHPIKQLDFLLQLLCSQTADINLTIAGVVDDSAYWEKCKTLIKRLPSNVKANYAGEVIHHQLASVINEHHLFTLPTMGENFGHAIYEALAAGRPILISDQTPWKNLSEVKAGWDISIKETEKFLKALQEAIDWKQETFNEWSFGARQYTEAYLKKNDLLEAYKNLFS